MTALVAWVALAWWGASFALLIVSSAAALLFPWPRRASPTPAAPPLTAIVPVKDLHEGFDAAQTSLFAQTYSDLEIIIGSAESASPALEAVRRIQSRFGHSDARLLTSPGVPAASPKLGNLWAPIGAARHDLILTKDSNVILAPGDVAALVSLLRPGIGLVSAITVIAGPGSQAAWVEASMINGCFARMLMLARALGMGFGLGKIMLFRRSDLERAGGLGSIAWALGEDSALAAALAGVGLGAVLADRVTVQEVGARSWRDLWRRLLRWKLIWRDQRPSVFAGSLMNSALLASLAALLAAPLIGLPAPLLAGGTLAAWCGLELAMCALKGWPVSLRSPLAFFQREIVDLLVWLRSLTTSEVVWAGVRCRSARPTPFGFAAEWGR